MISVFEGVFVKFVPKYSVRAFVLFPYSVQFVPKYFWVLVLLAC